MMKQYRCYAPLFLACIAALVLQACSTVAVAGGSVGALLISSERRMPGQILDDQYVKLNATQYILAKHSGQSSVEVVVYNGYVLLLGQVHKQAVATDIENAVKLHARDRVQVINEIETAANPDTTAQHAKDALLTSKVKWNLLQYKGAEQSPEEAERTRAIAKSVFQHTKVVTAKQTVYLMGLLTQQEQQFAARIAQETEGVKKVVTMFELWDATREQERKALLAQEASDVPAREQKADAPKTTLPQ